MASITKMVNGVVCTFTPAVFESLGPDNQVIEITSKLGSVPSDPIEIVFDKHVINFRFSLIGQTYFGHQVLVFSNGQEILSLTDRGTAIDNIYSDGRVTMTGTDLDNVANFAFSSVVGGPTTQNTSYTINSVSEFPITKILLLPPPADYVGYKDFSLVPSPLNAVSNPIGPGGTLPGGTPPGGPVTGGPTPGDAGPILPTTGTLPPQLPQVPIRSINLRDVVSIDTSTIDRQYIKGTMKMIQPAKIKVTNLSQELEIQVSLSGLAGVTFEPANFSLSKNSIQDVTVNFDLATIDGLPEGINTVYAAINLSSTSTILDPLPPVIING